MTDPNDDLAKMLGPRSGQPSPALREVVLRRTERRLVRDRWVRRAAMASGIAAVFLLGGTSGWLARTPVADAPGSPVSDVVLIPVPIPTPGVYIPGSSRVAPPLSASETELRAEQADDLAEAAKLYRTAGDAFLRQEDYANAARCYRQFLQRRGDAALAIETEDSWLLVSLKNAAFKEKIHVANIDD